MRAETDQGPPGRDATATGGTDRAAPSDSARSASTVGRHLDRLDASVNASTDRLEQALHGLVMRVELLESTVEDTVRSLRALQTAVAGIPTAAVDSGAMDRWAAEQADATRSVEKQLVAMTGQLEALRRRVPVRARDTPRPAVGGLDDATIDAIARAVASRLRGNRG